MAAPTTTTEALDQAALGPKSTAVDGVSATQRDLKELREQANYEAANTAADAQPHFGLRFTRLIPGARS